MLLVSATVMPAATITVDTDLDVDAVDGLCSLREAIGAANTDAVVGDCAAGDGPDRIDFSLVTPATILLSDPLPAISESLAIHGPGWLELEIDGDEQHRPLELDSPTGDAWLLVEDLSLVRGRAPSADDHGGGALLSASSGDAIFRRVRFIANHAGNGGGGLAVQGGSGTTLIDCYFNENVAEGPSGGGGLYIATSALDSRILRSAFVANRTEHESGLGGGLRVQSANLTVESSTFSANVANSAGGGLYAGTGSEDVEVILRDSTFAENTASADLVGSGGGGVAGASSAIGALHLVFENTVVADNETLGADNATDVNCAGSLLEVTATSSFVASNETCESFLPDGNPNADGNFVGTETAPLLAFLRPLDDDGGLTPTHAPSRTPLSPLIDQGSCSESVADQRGYGDAVAGLRPVDLPAVPNAAGSDACDIGAMEAFADPNADPLVFTDGFEAGHTLLWVVEIQ